MNIDVPRDLAQTMIVCRTSVDSQARIYIDPWGRDNYPIAIKIIQLLILSLIKFSYPNVPY